MPLDFSEVYYCLQRLHNQTLGPLSYAKLVRRQALTRFRGLTQPLQSCGYCAQASYRRKPRTQHRFDRRSNAVCFVADERPFAKNTRSARRLLRIALFSGCLSKPSRLSSRASKRLRDSAALSMLQSRNSLFDASSPCSPSTRKQAALRAVNFRDLSLPHSQVRPEARTTRLLSHAVHFSVALTSTNSSDIFSKYVRARALRGDNTCIQ